MERPKVTPEMIVEAVQGLAAENGWDAQQVADVAKEYRSHIDGYELAKALESNCHWCICAADVAALDCVDMDVREIHQVACLAWAKEHNIQPPLPIGTLTTKGEIVSIYEHDAACYLVRAPNETIESRRLIVRFEDARAVSVQQA